MISSPELMDVLRTEGSTDLLDLDALDFLLEDDLGQVLPSKDMGSSLAAFKFPMSDHPTLHQTARRSPALVEPNAKPQISCSGEAVDAQQLVGRASDGGRSDENSPDPEGGPARKKRTRNAQQMAQNRVAQQKYRERKKVEHSQVQQALDQLNAQLAAYKVLEMQTDELRTLNTSLSATASVQAVQLTQMAQKISMQGEELSIARKQMADMSALAGAQQRMILDQHHKLRLQEEVIDALKGRLNSKVEHAFSTVDPHTVCQRMCTAVREALTERRDVGGLQLLLEDLPEDVITDVCRAILAEVKNMWPDLAVRFKNLTCVPTSCGQQMTAVSY